MTYSAVDQVARRNLAGEHTANETSAEATFGRRGVISCAGTFVATVVLEHLAESEGAVAQAWVRSGELTEPGTAAFSHRKPVPWRYRVEAYVTGTVTVFLEIGDDLERST